MKLHWRVWLLIIAVVLSVIFISPRPWNDGVAITAVVPDSPAYEVGLRGPAPSVSPVMRERIVEVNGVQIRSSDDYQQAILTVVPNSTVQVRTNDDSYILFTPEENSSAWDPSSPLGFRVSDAATTNVRKGLDLTGGARVLLRPAEQIDDDTMDLVLANIQERLNIFGLSDIIVRPTQDFSGNQYILVEVAGINEQEIIELLSSQGRFEAKIGNSTVFTGGDDVTHVGRSATESGINRCSPGDAGYVCEFFFSISLSSEAAKRQADATRNLTVVTGPGGNYLSQPLELFLDGENVSVLQISSSLQGRAETQIQISGSEVGATEGAAAQAAQLEMKKLQTVLATGSLPVELEMVKTDTISPALGDSFIKNIWLVGIVALLAVIVVVATRYRDWRIGVPMIVAMLSEVVLVLGLASLVGWNLDLAAIAGILVAIGTGVDDQIIIVDEIKSGSQRERTWKQRMKAAFFIIFAAFFTLVAAMLPLIWAGAGLVRGFAITTVLGVTVGVLITRPAFAVIAEKFIKSD